MFLRYGSRSAVMQLSKFSYLFLTVLYIYCSTYYIIVNRVPVAKWSQNREFWSQSGNKIVIAWEVERVYNADMVNDPLDIDKIGIPQAGKPAPKPEKQSHLRVLANGAVYDMNKKRIVDSKNVTTKITSESAVLMQSRQQELKREALRRAANAVAAQGGSVDGRELTGDMAFVEAIGESMAMKALTVGDPKAVDAARFLFTEIGISEKKEVKQEEDTGAGADLMRALADIAGAVARQLNNNDTIPIQLHDTIEGKTEEVD